MDKIKNEALRLKLEGQLGSNKVLQLFSASFSTSSVFDKVVENKIAEMLDRFEFIVKQKDVLGLKVGAQHRRSHRLAPTIVEESDVYGRNLDKEAIVNMLLKDDLSGNRISVIPIVGMGGIGKTTLAQLVYNEDRVSAYFDLKAWVIVSDEFDVFRLAQKLLEVVTFRKCDIDDPYQVQVRLKESLKGKKFLFVLDDVWNENYDHWDALKSLFEYGVYGSKIIFTTRSESVATMMRNVPTYQLQTISNEHCWLLFAKHAFGNNVDSFDPVLEEIGSKIVHKCKGLPLAVKSLGGLLRYQLSPNKWEKILKSDIWELPQEENNILPVLWLSYYYLPSHLKRCFTYCSVFPKNYEFDKKKMILLWMAEDLLQPHKLKRIEDVGNEYFDELVSRSLFQQSNFRPQYFTMHDLVSDVATYVSGDFSMRLDDNDLSITSRTRHLSYMRKEVIDIEKLEVLSNAKRLRTFIGVRWQHSQAGHFALNFFLDKLLPTLLCLKVLSLSKCPIMELPETIGNLKNLRFLNLSWTEIRDIPDTVCSLYNLQTLLLSFCGYLTRLPTNIGNLISLRHLDIVGTSLREMPMELGCMKNLQTLSSFVLGKKSWSGLKLLKELKHLHGGLHISGLENVVDIEDVVEANLKDKKYLSQLSLEWEFKGHADDSRKEKDLLDKLQPHTSLEVLSISFYKGTKFPDWLGDYSFCNIVRVCLHNCKNCCLLPPLGQLPCLKELQIFGFDGVATIGEEFYFNGFPITKPFRSLKALSINNMLELQEWLFVENNNRGEIFPHLEELYLRDCPKLKVNFIDDHLPTLSKLLISGCENLESFQQLPSKLNSLSISNCEKLISSCLHHDMQRFTSLRHLKIMDHKLGVLDSFPKEMTLLLPIGLTHLWIINFPNLKALTSKAFQRLNSLEELRIHCCSELKCLPEEGLPSSLSYFSIYFCPSLSKRCKREEGVDWPKIAHIPRVYIDGKFI